MFAASNGHLSVVEYLVERGANVNTQDNVNTYLLVNRASLNCVQQGRSALHRACRSIGKAMEIIATLLKFSTKVVISTTTQARNNVP